MKTRLVLASLLAVVAASFANAQDAYDALEASPADVTLINNGFTYKDGVSHNPGGDELNVNLPAGSEATLVWTVPQGSYVTVWVDDALSTKMRLEYRNGDSGDWLSFATASLGKWELLTAYCDPGKQYRIRAFSTDPAGSVLGGIDEMTVTPFDAGDLGAALDSDLTFDNASPGRWVAQSDVSYDGVDAARSLTPSALLHASVTGPALISFEAFSPSGTITFSIDDTDALVTDKKPDWVREFAIIPAGDHDLFWKEVLTGPNVPQYAALDTVSLEPLQTGDANEAVDSTDITFTAPLPTWYLGGPGASSDGTDSLLMDSMGTDATLAGTMAGPLVLHYRVNASSSGTASTAYLGNPGSPDPVYAPVSTLANTTGWSMASITVPPGMHYLKWTANPGTGYAILGLDAFAPQAVQTPALATALNRTDLAWTTSPGDSAWWGEDSVSFDQDAAAASAYLAGAGQSWVQTSVTGPGTLSFRWKRGNLADPAPATANPGSTSLKVLLGEVVGGGDPAWDAGTDLTATDASNWSTVNVSVPSGDYAVRFQVDSSGANGGTLYYLDTVAYTSGPFPLLLPFHTAVRTGEGMTSPWFGFYWDAQEPWIYSADNGWLWVTGQDDSDVVYYDFALNEWFWTSKEFYRWIYCYGDSTWYYLFPHTPGTRVFYSSATGNYISEADWGN